MALNGLAAPSGSGTMKARGPLAIVICIWLAACGGAAPTAPSASGQAPAGGPVAAPGAAGGGAPAPVVAAAPPAPLPLRAAYTSVAGAFGPPWLAHDLGLW